MDRYVEMWTYTESFGTPRWTEEWELVTYPSIREIPILKKEWTILDMEMIHTSQHHWCVRKLYALQKDGRRHLEEEFVPCVDYTKMEKKYRSAFDYCRRKIHKLDFYPSYDKRRAPCLKAKHLLRSFIADTNSEVILFKGGIFEKRISANIGIESFNIEELGVGKVNTHDPKEEVNLHYDTLKWIIHGKFSGWRLKPGCSSTCGHGVVVYYRLCDNPRPQFGGDQCEGAYNKTEPCKDLLPCLGDNVALGKPSKQISTYANRANAVAAMANDGRYDTGIATNRHNNPWWEVDVQQQIKVRLIMLYLNEHAVSINEYRGFKLLTKEHSTSSWALCKNIAPVTTLQLNVTCDAEDTAARYFRLEIHDQSNVLIFYLVEVEIYKWG